MLIVQLANLVTPTSGGIRTVLEQLGVGYVARGHRRALIVPSARPSVELQADGSRRIELAGRAIPRSGGYRVLLDRAAVTDVLELLSPDAIEIHDRFTLIWVVEWARQRGIPTTVMVHERLETSLRTWAHLGAGAGVIERIADHRLLARAGRVVVPSRYAAAGFPDDDRVRVVPLGVDHDRFRPGPRGYPDAAAGPARLVSVGRLSREKRPELALATSVELTRRGVAHHLDVFGDGPLREALQRRGRGLPVTFHGHVGTEVLARHLADADVSLVCCPREAFGLAALESLASGTPIVSPSSGAVPELLGVESGERRLTAAGATARANAVDFAESVVSLLAIDRGDRRAAAAARARSATWTEAVEFMLRLHRPRRHPPAAVA